MKILEIIPQLSSGGAERFVVDLCNHLVKSNDVVLITYYQTGDAYFYLPELSDSVRHVALIKYVGV